MGDRRSKDGHGTRYSDEWPRDYYRERSRHHHDYHARDRRDHRDYGWSGRADSRTYGRRDDERDYRDDYMYRKDDYLSRRSSREDEDYYGNGHRSSHHNSLRGDHYYRRRDRHDMKRYEDDREYYRDANSGHYRDLSPHPRQTPRDRDRDRRLSSDSQQSSRERAQSASPPLKRRRQRQSPNDGPKDENGTMDGPKDERTVFVQQISPQTRPRELRDFFERGAGRVVDVSIIKDRVTNRAKGLAYVEFYSRTAVPAAIKLTGTMLRGMPILVELDESLKRRPAGDSTESATAGPHASKPEESLATVYVNGLGDNVTKDDLRDIMEDYGDISELSMHGTFAAVSFMKPSAAQKAVHRMHKTMIGGHEISVTFSRPKSRTTKATLMEKLMRDDDRLPSEEPVTEPAVRASRCVLLKNLFDPAEETGDTWTQDLEEDVQKECEEKYGRVAHLSLVPNSHGEIYIKFEDASAAERAVESLDKRYFGGRQITARSVAEDIYSLRFPGV